jgi:hypothetical protein
MPGPSDRSIHVLEFCRAQKIGANGLFSLSALVLHLTTRGMSFIECTAAIATAVELGWLKTKDPPGQIILTEAGFAAAQSAAPSFER